jgi:hypothetical protein
LSTLSPLTFIWLLVFLLIMENIPPVHCMT